LKLNLIGKNLKLLCAKLDLDKLEEEAKIRPPYPSAGKIKSITFQEFMELEQLNATIARQQNKSKKISTRASIPIVTMMKDNDKFSLSQTVKVIKRGVRKGNGKSYIVFMI
jgi:hypothetical protein